jgi:hypothetical protein
MLSTGKLRRRIGGGAAFGSAGCGWSPEAGAEGEGAAPAWLAVHCDLPAHQGHSPGGDRQAQARAAILRGRRRICLLEGAEDRRLFIDGNTDAGVAHAKTQ